MTKYFIFSALTSWSELHPRGVQRSTGRQGRADLQSNSRQGRKESRSKSCHPRLEPTSRGSAGKRGHSSAGSCGRRHDCEVLGGAESAGGTARPVTRENVCTSASLGAQTRQETPQRRERSACKYEPGVPGILYLTLVFRESYFFEIK